MLMNCLLPCTVNLCLWSQYTRPDGCIPECSIYIHQSGKPTYVAEKMKGRQMNVNPFIPPTYIQTETSKGGVLFTE